MMRICLHYYYVIVLATDPKAYFKVGTALTVIVNRDLCKVRGDFYDLLRNDYNACL